ncbi:PQQ-dependent sugar dehydrogenase [Sphingomonas sp. XXL09]|uniref:PQQ-dependent sugar dehydrogenase n=1 Tax=Sphingomonas sp. XXL09 TaxID=3457787 RepID=UPI00406BD9F6
MAWYRLAKTVVLAMGVAALPNGAAAIQSGAAVRAASGLTVGRFAEGLYSPRNAIVLPNGDVLVAEAQTERKNEDPSYHGQGRIRILLLRDTDGDGRADRKTLFLSGLRQPNGMALIRNRLYVANADGVFWTPYRTGQTEVVAEAPRTMIARFDPTGCNNHWTRNLLAGGDGRPLYVAVGSASNAGEYSMAEEQRRAAILSIDPATGRERIIADGIRNPVGMAIETARGRLWTAANERDELSDDLIPDYITAVRDGGFYGWPYSYWGKHPDPRRKGQRPDLVARAITPNFAVGAHAAALAITFGRSTVLPARYRDGASVARHGSWNRSQLMGYDVVFVPFRDGRAVEPMEPVLTGFSGGPGHVHGRPRALAVAPDGALLVVDEKGGTIWRIAAAGRK